MFTFDGPNRLIIVDSGITSFSASQVYSDWKEWVIVSDNAKFLPAFANSVGGNGLGSGTSLGAYYFIQNGWKIRPQEADHILTVSGNLFAIPDTAAIFEPTVGDYNVQIVQQVSSLTQAVSTTGGSGASAQEIWEYDISSITTGNQAGKQLNDAVQSAKNAFAASV